MSALRTISLRLRGTSVEILEEMGEETEGVVESTSKLQEKLKALTGVDILTDSGAYKDTYTILKEIGEVWEDLDPMDQAAALELMAGKNRANTLAAILNNMEDLKGAYADALGAEGSAMRENETFLNSIEGRISLFNNALQTMWMNFIDDGTVKSIVDLGTAFIKLTDNVGVFKMALAGVAVYLTAFKKINPMTMVKDAMSSMQNYTNIVKQIQSINSMVGPAKAMSFEQFNAGPVNAYAAAVSNLTAKQQAATLAASGLNSEQIASVLTKNGLSAANVKLAMSEAGVAQATTQTATVTGLQIAATMKQQGVALSQNATNFLLAHSTEEVTKKMLAKAVVAGQITHQEAVLIMTSMGVVAANTAQAFSWKALGTAISAAFKSNPIGMLISLASAISAIVLPALDALIDSTEEVKQRAEDALAEYSNSQSELKTIKSNLDALSDDYEKLAVGVDEFGNNINLSTSQYERYNEIVNQIADMFPQMVKGYTAEGNAIIKNKGNVEALTAAYESLQSVASNTLLASADDIMENYENTFQAKWYENGPSTDANKIKASRELSKMLNNQDTYNFGAFLYDNKNDGIITTMVNLLKDAGIEKEAWYEGEDEYIKRAIKDFPGIVQSIVNTWESTANAAVSNVKPLISAYLDTSVGYAGLNEEQKQIIDSMVASLDEEFFNAFDGDASKLYMALESMIQNLKTSGFDDEYNLMLNIKTSFNNNDITVEEYQSEINNFKAKLDALVADGLLSETDAKYIKLSIGIDDEGMGNELDSMVAYAQKIVDTESKDKVLTLTYSDLQIINSDEFEVPEGTLLSWEELKQKIAEIRATLPTDVNTIQTYTALSERISGYNDILTQTNEITANNIEVSQEYKDSLSDLGFTTEELSECFDENNGLVVKNAALLNKLVAAKKKEIASDTKLARSQAKLQYYELYKEMRRLTNGKKVTNSATLDYINTLYAQMTALEKTIAKYSLLESTLLGATNAYDQLEEAQAFDEQYDYGSKAEEMVNVLANAFNTAELGTQAAKVAIAGLIPESEIDKAKELDDQMQQIYDYFTKGEVSQLFTIEFDDDGGISSVEMTKENVEKFTQGLIDAGKVFTGSWDEFEFADDFAKKLEGSTDPLQTFADELNITKEVAFAYLTELEKFDINWLGGDYETLLDQLMSGNLEYAIDKNLQALADLEYKAAHGGFDYEGGAAEYKRQYDALKKQYDENQDKARENVSNWTEATSDIEAAQKTVDDLYAELNKQKELKVDTTETEKQLQTALEELYKTQAVLNGLEEPTAVVLQIASEEVEAEIEKIKQDLSEKGLTIESVLTENEDGTFTIKAEYAEEFGNLATLMNEQASINKLLDTGVTSTNEYLSTISTNVAGIYSLFGGKPLQDTDGNATTTSDDDSQNTAETVEVTAQEANVEGADAGSGTDNVGQPYDDPAYATGGTQPTGGESTDTGELDSKISDLNSQLKVAQEKVGQLETSIETLKAEKTTLEAAMDTAKAEADATISKLTAEKTDADETIAKLTAQKAELEESIAQLTASKAEADKTIEQLNADKTSLETSIANANTVISQLETEKAELNTAIAESEANIEALKADKAGVESDLAQAKEMLSQTKAMLEEAQSALEVANNDLAVANNLITSLTTTNQNLESQVADLNAQLNSANADLANSQAEKAAADATIAKLESALADAEGIIEELSVKQDGGKGDERVESENEEDWVWTDSITAEDSKKYVVEADVNTESAEEELENLQDTADEISIEPLNLTWDDGHGTFYADGNDPLGLNNAYLSVERLMAALDNLGMDYKKIDFNLLKPETWFSGDELKFNILDLVDTLRASGWTPEAIQAYCTQLSESANVEGGIITIEGLEEVDSYLETLDSLQISDKTTDVEVTGAAEAEKELNNVTDAAKDETKTVTVVTRYVTDYQTVGTNTVHTPGSGGRYTMANGTAHADGTAHKGGSWGAPKTETALVGELGPEMVNL